MANFLLEKKIKDLNAVLWYGQYVVERYTLIQRLLTAKLDPQYAHILATPQVTSSAIQGSSTARWFSGHVSDAAVPLTELDEVDYQKAIAILNERLDQIREFANGLVFSENEENVKWGQLISKAIQFPDESYVFFENGKVLITAWSFELKDPSKKIVHYTRDEKVSPRVLPFTPEDQAEEDPPPPEENIEEEDVVQARDKTKEKGTAGIEGGNKISNGRFGFFRKNWWKILLLVLLILLLLFWFKDCSGTTDSPSFRKVDNVIKPIPPGDIAYAEDTLTKIVANRVNVALKGEHKDLSAFAKEFYQQYNPDSFRIIYKDPKTARLQIEVPNKGLENFMESLDAKMSNFQLLIWHERIFERNRTFNDPGFSSPKQSWYFEEVQAQGAWDITQGDQEIVIAVIDAGFDLNHPEIKQKIYKPWNVFKNSAKIPYEEGLSMHGTHVAGTIAGVANNQLGVSGIAPNCRIMPIKVADDQGNITNTSVIDGILYAINNGAKVINISLGLYINPLIENVSHADQSYLIKNKFNQEEAFWNELFGIAMEEKVSVVLAGGNQNALIGLDPMARANYPLKVSAIDDRGAKTSFSNWGDKSDLSAPGYQIYNATAQRGFEFLDGTSMAAPIVSAGVALMHSHFPEYSFSEIKQILQSTGKLALSYGNQPIGNIIQIERALTHLSDTAQAKSKWDCDNVQDKIDSLQLLIEKLKMECENPTSYDTLQFPIGENLPLERIKGRWKSTTPLINSVTEEPVELYFEFIDQQTGRLILVEHDGTICKADLKLNVGFSSFEFSQVTETICDDQSKYNTYTFACSRSPNGTAVCEGVSESNRVDFYLVKIK